jgi:hypothetical protein
MAGLSADEPKRKSQSRKNTLFTIREGEYMNRRDAIGSVIVGAAATASMAVGQAADREIEILVGHWQKSKDLTLKVADVMPAENYDYKPFADARSFGAELQHLGQAEGYYLGQLGKGRAPSAPANDTRQDSYGQVSDG